MTSLSETQKIDICTLTGSKLFLTRDQGNELKIRVLDMVKNNSCLIIDFSNVEALSPSFADELFGGLEKSLGDGFKKKIKIHCPKDDWKRLISSALARRRLQQNN